MQFTNCTARKPLFHDPYDSYESCEKENAIIRIVSVRVYWKTLNDEGSSQIGRFSIYKDKRLLVGHYAQRKSSPKNKNEIIIRKRKKTKQNRKKSKLSLRPITKDPDTPLKKQRFEGNWYVSGSQRETRENVSKRFTVTSDWLTRWRKCFFLSQSPRALFNATLMQNQSKHELLQTFKCKLLYNEYYDPWLTEFSLTLC